MGGRSKRRDGSSSGTNASTVMAATGLAATTSALILVVGLVAMSLTVEAGRSAPAATTPTVVSLGEEQPQVGAAPNSTGTEPTSEATPRQTSTTQAAEAPELVGAPGPVQQQEQPSTPSGPSGAPTLRELNGQLTTLSGDASSARKAELLEGGARAVGPISKVLYLVKQYSYTGFKYKVVGPVKRTGSTTTARLQMTLPGSGSRYIPLSWVWRDGAWKLTNRSVCAVASYAQMPCSL